MCCNLRQMHITSFTEDNVSKRLLTQFKQIYAIISNEMTHNGTVLSTVLLYILNNIQTHACVSTRWSLALMMRLNVSKIDYILYIYLYLHLHECVESKVRCFFSAFSVRIPCHNVCVMSEYVAASIIRGTTNRIPSRNRLYARSKLLEFSGQSSRHLWWPN